MRLGFTFGYQDWGKGLPQAVETARLLDRLGYESMWTAEAYGTDAATPLAALVGHTERIKIGSAVFQMPARTPAMTAMTAITLDAISNGRFLLGLGTSGPQVVEGWHGVPYGKPIARTREFVDIVREIIRRDGPVTYHGKHLSMPYQGPDATGLGKPLKLITHPRTPTLPIYLAAIGPKNVELTAEIANGWLPLFVSPTKLETVWGPHLRTGEAKRDPALGPLDIAAAVPVHIGTDLEAMADAVRPLLALYVGGMGAKGKNFYFDLVSRYGYEADAVKIQDLYLAGHVNEAIAAVPFDLADEVSLLGPPERIRDRVVAWSEAGIGKLIASNIDPVTLTTLAEIVL